MRPTQPRNQVPHHMAGTTRASTPSGTSPLTTATTAPDTPTSLTSQPTSANTLAPIAAVASALGTSTSPKSQKALSPRFSPRPLTGAAALEDQRRLREQQERAAASTRTSPNPSVAAINSLLGQSSARMAPLNPNPPEQIAQMAQKIHIPENNGHHTSNNDSTMQTSPVSMSSVGSLDTTTAANATTTAPILAPSMPASAENPFPDGDPHAPRPAVDAGVSGDHRALTFPPPPGEDPRNPHRNNSMPNTGMSSPRSTSAKRHKCPYCSTVFTRHHNLKSHLLTHSHEKPFECQQCQSRFRRLHDLKRHMKLHTGERPHECLKCGRKFARGDALARHNKGQGGCAGRRSSFGIDPDDAEGRDHMSGIEYTAEPDQMDEDNDLRRGSEPSRDRQNSGAYRAGPSTYPPPAIASSVRGPGAIAPMYPPNPPSSQREASSPHQASLSSISHFTSAGPGVFQSGVTESPKPLSPSQTNSHRGSASGPPSHAYSYSRGSGPQLPPLPPMQHGSMPPPNSQQGSVSSGGSAASGREILGQRDGDWRPSWEADQRLAKMQEDHLANLARIQSDRSRSEASLNAKINDLENENRSLKDAQMAQEAQIKRLLEEVAALKSRQETVTA
ncbi:hypothetical protein, variant [Verruconis gallopava]|uniref:C2H2-type domain-containing protein n=1 Tax=Verruconis gallopava TaxID=253628 RepID=A0A0D2A576_9PEZI|nr:uncharacterized protein PV09_06853 [Verruconis gallopava]XP_016211539.1 hypothetical protein, variant [Verruconis gallopava]KIW01669.1 hypothetical protein PV09_06853 [Verruconis gallopava]KIW01670.1 hypothetical protein, variant [Verruconis gallopava]